VSKGRDIALGLTAVLAIGLASCRSPGAQLDRSRREAASWAASAQWAASAWAANQVPIAYAQDSVDLACQSIREERAKVARLSGKVGSAGPQHLEHLDRLRDILDPMAAALRRADREAVTSLLRPLAERQQELSGALRSADRAP
jgi:hypothetical protein